MDKKIENRFSFSFNNKSTARNVIKSSISTSETDPIQYYKKSTETLDEFSVPNAQNLPKNDFYCANNNKSILKSNSNDSIDSLLKSNSITDKVCVFNLFL